jgi:uncharacterized membrane protein HdeD (DUF308 family)
VRKVQSDANSIREAVLLSLACLVALVWAVTQLASVFFARPVEGEVHVIMLAVVTALFGSAAVAGRKSGNGNGDKNGTS